MLESALKMQEMAFQRPKFQKTSGGACPWTPEPLYFMQNNITLSITFRSGDILKENITKSYKLGNNETIDVIDNELIE